ncbi:MAG: diguanylate cyclase [Planctomycetota bacterium]|nr:diguanylate cyclase [Planctomycetota bacterium]
MSNADHKSNVLLIDDSADIHRLLSFHLRNEDLTLHTETSGADGVRAAQTLDPALILLDLNMPGIDGFETLRRLKTDPITVDIPVIVISGSDETSDKVRGQDLGAIDYVCKPFSTPDEIAELKARVRAALRLSHLMRLLAQRAQIDGLTGLWNRKHFDERLAIELGVRQRTGRPLTLCLCDLDHFKSVNDNHGHAAGDVALQGFANILTSHLRRQDLACRYGGEEFGLILRDTTAAQSITLLERIRADLQAKRWPRHPDRPITASFGVCDIPIREPEDPTDQPEPQDWLEAADQALYHAKQTGRNRIINFADIAPEADAQTRLGNTA